MGGKQKPSLHDSAITIEAVKGEIEEKLKQSRLGLLNARHVRIVFRESSELFPCRWSYITERPLRRNRMAYDSILPPKKAARIISSILLIILVSSPTYAWNKR